MGVCTLTNAMALPEKTFVLTVNSSVFSGNDIAPDI